MAPQKCEKAAHDPVAEDEKPLLDKDGRTHIQIVIWSILWYAHAIDLMVLMAVPIIATEQYQPTNKMIKNIEKFLDYLATNTNATM